MVHNSQGHCMLWLFNSLKLQATVDECKVENHWDRKFNIKSPDLSTLLAITPNPPSVVAVTLTQSPYPTTVWAATANK